MTGAPWRSGTDHFPAWLGRVRLRHGDGKRVEHVVCDDAAGLVYLANQAAIELHSWLSRADAPRSPDWMVFDLDPPRDDAFEEVRAGARAFCALLDQVGLVPFLKTTGSRGRLFLDVLRNAYGQTLVAPYSVRARPGAPVATPIDRVELDDGSLRADRWTLRNLFRRLGQREDPWRGMGRQARSLAAARRRLDALRAAGD